MSDFDPKQGSPISEIADDAGNVISGVRRLRLGPGLTLTRNDNDPSAVIDVAAAASAVAQAELLGSEIPTQGSNLTDANATVTIADGAQQVLAAGTLTTNRVLTLGVTGSPITGETKTIIRRDVSAFTYTIQDDTSASLFVMPASTKFAAYFRFNGLHFTLASAVRIQ